MLRIVLRFVGAAAAALILIDTFAPAADPGKSHSFKLTIASHIEMEIQGKKKKIDADTAVHYTWKQRGRERTLSFDSMRVEVSSDGKQRMNTFMSRAKLTSTEQGKTTVVSFEEAPEQLKKILRDSFDVPVCKLHVDENGKEVKREVVAGPGAKDLVDQGMIANALLFHPPFPRVKNEWSAAAQISMGNGGFAKGKLTYKKASGGKGGQAVKVSGILTNESFKLPNSPLTITKAKYVVNGEQTCDPAQREWISGKLTVDVSYQMAAGDNPVASAKGRMVLKFDKLPGKK